MEVIKNSAIYAKKLESDYLPKLYYLVFWKKYLKAEYTWVPYSAIQYLRKLISSFHKDYPNKLTAIFKSINTILAIANLIIKPILTTKRIK